MIYLATPYTDPKSRVREERFKAAVRLTAYLQSAHPTKVLFSPIVHSHPLDRALAGSFNYTHWINWSSAMLDLAEAMWVIMMPGWEESRGVGAEINQCHAAGKPVRYVYEDTLRFKDA